MRRRALITGAGSGIGRAVAQTLAARGYRLALAGRRTDALEETCALLEGEGHFPVAADVTDPDSVAALFETTVDTFGRLDLLFNNAGVSIGGAIDSYALDDWKRTVDTNLTGAFLCLQAAFRVMKAQEPRGGRIINNGSISAHAPRPESIAYTATKHAVTGLTRSCALDGRGYDIACGQIDIGNAASAMGSVMAEGVPQANGTRMAEPVMDVAQVGEAVAYMDSLPLEANVAFMTVMATKMPFVGRG
ncbi:SDR family oxidoreductase [Novosphingobium sp. MBES04]|uniref:SDR family oxidoreductase n=1 Tax=Novosphingobium sp. MBES04 TaxID=1206458 RepID=UPI00057C4524|nr:SDR family oxidoreductase [Novosphingobium sp. MBES04]GAM05108.1 short-chain dehydrogenase/reductase SDR [Novosphingobium sp. MBES04]